MAPEIWLGKFAKLICPQLKTFTLVFPDSKWSLTTSHFNLIELEETLRSAVHSTNDTYNNPGTKHLRIQAVESILHLTDQNREKLASISIDDPSWKHIKCHIACVGELMGQGKKECADEQDDDIKFTGKLHWLVPRIKQPYDLTYYSWEYEDPLAEYINLQPACFTVKCKVKYRTHSVFGNLVL